jgi:hypothetical protein
MEDLPLFDTLRAEEEPFLPKCYVKPSDFSMIASTRSAVILGQTGSGKTALSQAIVRHINPPGRKMRFLVVPWNLPLLLDQELEGLALVLAQVKRIMDPVARALIRHLARYPADWEAAPPWCQDRLHWFIHEYLEGDQEHLFHSLGWDLDKEGQKLLRDLACRPAIQVLKPESPPHLVMERLLDAWKVMGYQGIVILMDGVEPWLLVAPGQMASSLHAFLSTLPLFECPGFSFKLLLPARLERSLGSAGAALRGRVNWHNLEWKPDQLRSIVELRLALALGEESVSLEELAKGSSLVDWLFRCGGLSPRGWLGALRPFVDAYEEAGCITLSDEECEAIQMRNPPRLFVDPATKEILVGHRPISKLTDGLDAVLHYLYEHRGRVCHRRDLYVTYMDALYPDRERLSILTASDYGGVMDTVLWRLRQAVEPDPTNPVHIVTVKGRGVRLDNTL